MQEASAETALRDALLESRQRWRDLVSMAGDMAFETDADGHFAFIAPDMVAGWAASQLVGQPAELLLAKVDGNTAFNPFRPAARCATAVPGCAGRTAAASAWPSPPRRCSTRRAKSWAPAASRRT